MLLKMPGGQKWMTVLMNVFVDVFGVVVMSMCRSQKKALEKTNYPPACTLLDMDSI